MNGRLDMQGDLFNSKVASFFEGFPELKVKSRVGKVGRLRELQDHLGDIDVLVGDKQKKRILVIECKDLAASRTPYEMANEFASLFVGTQGKKSIMEKHSARMSWVASNKNAIVQFLELNPAIRWEVLPLIVVDQPLISSYVRTCQIQLISFEELKRFWPNIRRA